jgi:hypothetical protein
MPEQEASCDVNSDITWLQSRPGQDLRGFLQSLQANDGTVFFHILYSLLFTIIQLSNTA